MLIKKGKNKESSHCEESNKDLYCVGSLCMTFKGRVRFFFVESNQARLYQVSQFPFVTTDILVL